MRYFALVFLSILFPLTVGAQQQTQLQPNTVVLTEMLDSAAQQLAQELLHEPCTIVVTGHPDSLWIQAVIAGKNNSGDQVVRVVPVDVSVRYVPAESADSVERICTVVLAVDVQSGSPKKTTLTPRLQKKIVARKQIEWLNDAQHLATNPVEPPKPRSIWDDILEPVVFVAAAIVTVGLFFTVRSQ